MRVQHFSVPKSQSIEDKKLTELPSVTVLISAFNEQKHLVERIDNLAQQTFTQHPDFRVFIGSDGSSDATAALLLKKEKEYSWLTAVISDENRGKASMINDLLANVTSDIIVFTDADVVCEPDCIELLVRRFSSIRVGGVEARILIEPHSRSQTGSSTEESAYYNYDTNIRVLQSFFGVVTGMKGQCYAIRHELIEPIPVAVDGIGVTDDLYHSLLPLAKGYTLHIEDRAIARTPSVPTLADEFARKVRFSATTFSTLAYFPPVLWSNNFLLTYSFWSHRMAKWFFPFVLITLFGTNMLLVSSWQYALLYAIQIFFYFVALVGWYARRAGVQSNILLYPTYFVVANAALFSGFVRFVLRKNFTKWNTIR